MICSAVLILTVAAALAAILLRRSPEEGARVAYVYSHGELVKTIELEGVREPFEFTVGSESGEYNVVSVSRDGVSVVRASCPDKVCVNRGVINSPGLPIVCLPNELIVSVGGEAQEADAVAR